MAVTDDRFAAVDALSIESDESEKPSCSRASKRKRADSAQPPNISEALRAMLGRPKCGCKHQCLSQFVDDHSFNQLFSFRKDWSALHKLDQDSEASWVGF